MIKRVRALTGLEFDEESIQRYIAPDPQGSQRDYRPPTLAAVIDAHRAGQGIHVVGYDGPVMPVQSVPWPE